MISRRAALTFHAHIIPTCGQIHDRIRPGGGRAPWQSRPARHTMTADLPDRVTIAGLAERCGLSVSYFVDAFRKKMGVPPCKWLMNRRVRRAKDLLRRSELTLLPCMGTGWRSAARSQQPFHAGDPDHAHPRRPEGPSRPQRSAEEFTACRIKSAISFECEIIERWLAGSSMVVAFMRLARNFSRSGEIVWSWVETA